MTTNEMIAVITAHEEGKTIEFKLKCHPNNLWGVIDKPTWDFCNCDYRIKPEPMVRPYRDAKEYIADSIKHGGWLKSKKTDSYFTKNCLSNDTDYSALLKDYRWADDGSPCGFLED